MVFNSHGTATAVRLEKHMQAPLPASLLSPRVRFSLLACMAACGLLLLWLGNFTNLDVRLAESMFDERTRSFPWQHAWLTERFGHEIVKRVLIGLALVPILLCIGDSVLRTPLLAPWWRLRVRVVAACALLIPTVTSLLKQASVSHCPWDLQRFGGSEPYYRLLDHVPAWVDAGKCLPGGHASSALWLLGLVAFWLPHRPKSALLMAVVLALPGLALGWLQQMRGAHFLSHNLWSLWIASAILIAVLGVAQRRGWTLPGRIPAGEALS